jgi:hypothetical protein
MLDLGLTVALTPSVKRALLTNIHWAILFGDHVRNTYLNFSS